MWSVSNCGVNTWRCFPLERMSSISGVKSAAGGAFVHILGGYFRWMELWEPWKNLERQVSKREAVFLVLDNHVGPCDGVYKSFEAFLSDPELTGSPYFQIHLTVLSPEHLKGTCWGMRTPRMQCVWVISCCDENLSSCKNNKVILTFLENYIFVL